jgi:1,4-alpha-glucan branching enzyme
VANFTPQSHSHYRVGVPVDGFYEEAFNTDSERYGGSNLGNLGGKFTDQWSIHGYDHSLDLCLPPLSLLVFRRDPKRSQITPGSTDTDSATDDGGREDV